jgi:hypothetical protein
MLLFSSLTIFAAVVAAPIEELEVVDVAECEEVLLYDEAEEVLDSQEIVFFDDELEGEVESFLEE